MARPVRDPELESSERVTISSLPMSVDTASGPRVAYAHEIPSRWLERLLTLSLELPTAHGEIAVARAVVDTIASMLPDYVVGACLIVAGDQRVVRSVPEGHTSSVRAADPSRIFPEYSYERIIEIPASGGATLHLASEDAACEDERALPAALLDRAARLIRRGFEQGHVHTRAATAGAELRSLHTHMAQAEKLASLGQIAAGVVHELNNPLTSIVAYTDFLIRRATARAEATAPDELDRLRRIAESAGRMLRFTRDLVSYARPSGEASVPVNVQTVVEQALAFCEHILTGAGAVVERHFAAFASPPFVRGKPEQLAQVFVNLITNACHALPPEGGRVVVTIEAEGDALCILVADNGRGILPEHLPHVFTPFFTTKGNGEGTGLGLTIVKSILDAHEGTIAAHSVVGEGTSFLITLPVARR
jgi:C4-dicarboxylate-specific signal transduction histidine kinase